MACTVNEKKGPLMMGQMGLTAEGLGWAAFLASQGGVVFACDPDVETVLGIGEGVLPGELPGLSALVKKGLSEKKLQLLEIPRRIYRECDMIFVDAPMPPDDEDMPSLRFLETSLRQAANQCISDTVMVIRAAILPDQFRVLQEQVNDIISKREEDVHITLCVMPVLYDGDLIKGWQHKMPFIIGCDDHLPGSLSEVLKIFPNIKHRLFVCSPEEACTISYGFSGYAAMRQTYIENLMDLSRKIGVSPVTIKDGIDRLITNVYLSPINIGMGYGGTQLYRNTTALSVYGKKEGVRQQLLEETQKVRDRQSLTQLSRLLREIRPEGKNIAVLGLAPIGDTDDLRETPAVEIIKGLVRAGASVRLYMPQGMDQAKWRFYRERDAFTFCESTLEAVKGTDVMIIAGKWKSMNRLLTKNLSKKMKGKVIYDPVCGLDQKKAKALGFEYHN